VKPRISTRIQLRGIDPDTAAQKQRTDDCAFVFLYI